MSLPAFTTVQFRRGVYLPAHDFWLDPADSQAFAFVSHAHADHIGRHHETVVSEITSRLMHARLPGDRLEHRLPFGQPAEGIRPNLRMTLYPAGHIAGSAQLFLEEKDTGATLLYTGDFKLRSGLSAEPTGWTQADTLIMETTFGLPRFKFPATVEVLAQIVKFCREAIEEDVVPVLFGYSLGKSQEILCALSQAGLPAMLHGAVHRMTEVYREIRPDFPSFDRYDPAGLAGKVLICPPSANQSRMLQKIKARRTAMLTGWALTPGAVHRYQTDAVFPLSDHADYDDLIRYVELVKPRRVLTLHGYAAAFATDLRARGIEAWALSEENQMELLMPVADLAGETPAPVFVAADGLDDLESGLAPSEFRQFADVGQQIAATTGKLKKIDLLSTYFRTLDEAALPFAALFLTGRAFAQSDPRVLNIGSSVVRRSLLALGGISEERLRQLGSSLADLPEVAGVVLPGRTRPEPFSLVEAMRLFDDLEQTRGPLAKTERLQQTLARLDPLEGQYLIKILTGELRIGLKDGLLEEALAVAFEAPADSIREANMLLGDLGRVALLAKQGNLARAELTLFQPIKSMLASPELTAESIWERVQTAPGTVADPAAQTPVAPGTASFHLPAAAGQVPASTPTVVWIEDKFDGVRAQLHRDADGRVEIYSRDLRTVTGQFAEVAAAAAGLRNAVIFDGEIVAYEKGKKLTFFDLQKRLGRRAPDLFMGEAVPIYLIVFDLLHLDGRTLLTEPLAERRRLLEGLRLPGPLIRRVDVVQAGSAAEIDETFRGARIRGNEGLIVKDPASLYTPGRRGLAWLKLKKELATLDVVIVGAEWGHGKRNAVLSDYTFAVRDEENGGELKTIGKAYSGLTDPEILELTTHLQQTTLSVRGKYHEVRPDTVLEIAFDSVQPSHRHTSGLSLRFPRIKALRRDKEPSEIDSVAFARTLCDTPTTGTAAPKR